MSTTSTARDVVKEVKLNYFSVVKNSNKVWIGRSYSDGYYDAEYGRVGSTLTKRGKQFSSVTGANTELMDKAWKKQGEGYRLLQTVDVAFDPKARVLNTPLGAITEDVVKDATRLLNRLERQYDVSLVEEYYRLIPHTFSGQIPNNLLRNSDLIGRERQLLRSLDVALAPASATEDAFAAADAALAELSRMFGV